ncbi:hypothetical protein OG693_39245 (plasmid) [Streptomyces sp. NBC_01259]|uniref:hypothetical protein n=1 Tax=Streptomyces sp. NBC_01259 TaxID=2903800 RepID=UPI002F918DAC
MATRYVTGYHATCDICGDHSEEGSGWGDTPEEAITDLLESDSWTQVGDRIICDRLDPTHTAARGGPSPLLLHPTHDAMTVTYTTNSP